MKAYYSARGFVFIMHIPFPKGEEKRLVSESSNIEPHLWIDENFHLNRKEVKQLKKALSYWLKFGRLPIDKEEVFPL